MNPFFLLWVALLEAEAWGPYSQGMHEIKPGDMTRADPTERVAVFHVEAPLSMEKVGPMPGLIASLYHTGLVFYVPSSNVNSSIEFDADNFGPGVVIPTLTPAKNEASPTITWDNAASIYSYEGVVDYTYWLKKKHLGTISGSKYNMLLTWLAEPSTVQTFSTYYLLQLQNDPPLIPSTTCDDFVLAALKQLEEVEGSALQPWMGRDSVYRVMQPNTTLTKLDASDPKVHARLVEYYTSVSAEMAKIEGLLSDHNALSIKAAIVALQQNCSSESAAGGQSILYVGGDYYQFTSMFPYCAVTYNNDNVLSALSPPVLLSSDPSPSSTSQFTTAIAVLGSLLAVAVVFGGVMIFREQRTATAAAANADDLQYSQLGDGGVELRKSHANL
jgi:hypothetical protein